MVINFPRRPRAVVGRVAITLTMNKKITYISVVMSISKRSCEVENGDPHRLQKL